MSVSLSSFLSLVTGLVGYHLSLSHNISIVEDLAQYVSGLCWSWAIGSSVLPLMCRIHRQVQMILWTAAYTSQRQRRSTSDWSTVPSSSNSWKSTWSHSWDVWSLRGKDTMQTKGQNTTSEEGPKRRRGQDSGLISSLMLLMFQQPWKGACTWELLFKPLCCGTCWKTWSWPWKLVQKSLAVQRRKLLKSSRRCVPWPWWGKMYVSAQPAVSWVCDPLSKSKKNWVTLWDTREPVSSHRSLCHFDVIETLNVFWIGWYWVLKLFSPGAGTVCSNAQCQLAYYPGKKEYPSGLTGLFTQLGLHLLRNWIWNLVESSWISTKLWFESILHLF